MKNKLYVFRVDIHPNIGYGHYSRCLNLAKYIKYMEPNSNIVMIGRGLSPKTNNMIIHVTMTENFDWEITKNTKTWLGDNIDNDTHEFIKHKNLFVEQFSLKNDIKYLIIDHYAIDINWEDKVKPDFDFILVIDDLADRMHDCNLLIDQTNYPLGFNPYRMITTKNTTFLLGTKYFMLTHTLKENVKDYSHFRSYYSENITEDYKTKFKNIMNTISKTCHVKILYDDKRYLKSTDKLNVLISFGGSDPKNYTLSVTLFLLKYFNNILLNDCLREGLNIHKTSKFFTKPNLINFIIVTGPLVDINLSNQIKDGIMDYVNSDKYKIVGTTFEFYHDIDHNFMLQLISRSDLALGAAGVSSYERCLSGLPSIIFIIAENQRKNANYLDKDGFAKLIDFDNNHYDIQLENAINDLIKNDFDNMRKMSEHCLFHFDSNGTQRIYSAITQLSYF